MPGTEGNEETGKPVIEENPLLQKVQQYILSKYAPTDDPLKAVARMSTNEIYLAVYSLCPLPEFTPYMLAAWLNERGFTFCEAGSFRFEWLFKNVD